MKNHVSPRVARTGAPSAGQLAGRVFAALLVLITLTGCQRKEPAANTRHARYVVGLSPFLEQPATDEVFRHLVHFLLEDMPLNSSLWIYDAYHLRTITQIEIPNVNAFQSGRTRANQFSGQIQSLKAFLATRHEQPVVSSLDFAHAIRLPQFLQFVGDNLAATNLSVTTVLLGSPLYLDEKEPGFSMMDGYFPSDGHLLATREKSIYGLGDVVPALKEVIVHHGYFGDPWTSELHQQRVARFWGHFLRRQGAQLATFTGDLPTTFNALRQPRATAATFGRDELDPAQGKVEMLRISRDVGVADWITRELPADHRPPPPTTLTGPLKIGIRWEGNIDLDLYARPEPRGETLFFQHQESAAGYYFKDHRSSPEREFEFIEFTRAVDLREVEASVNFYEGRTPAGPEGEIRVEFQGRIYTGRFALAAREGNQGRGGPRQDDHWRRIDLLRVVGVE
ncbi:MAG TPA: hypothetical protein DCY13_09555 [Verrucomicrobiales bacterium]|nr:hypothetical protein [Verrucomicrobiales bacterium]